MTKTPAYERTYDIEGSKDKILLRIFEPRAEVGEWVCEYRIETGFDQPILVPVFGADKLESVTSAFRRIRSDLAIIAERLGRQVTLFRSSRLDDDLPLHPHDDRQYRALKPGRPRGAGRVLSVTRKEN